MLKRVSSTSNSSSSLRHILEYEASLSCNAAIITGVMVEGRPAPFEGALVEL